MRQGFEESLDSIPTMADCLCSPVGANLRDFTGFERDLRSDLSKGRDIKVQAGRTVVQSAFPSLKKRRGSTCALFRWLGEARFTARCS
jgi:predicted metal-dependent HD superfamily phosphohydrolase